ncbi:MAG: DUF4080 domain-containing protein [Oscillospiraceae bacterium]|nr:DUF4080 domain-containing protein [Oscillospiraceae bacterium]
MKTLLVAINAKFSHTNLAVRCLKKALEAAGTAAEIAEFTINQPVDLILREIAAFAPERILFSCYIWNIALVRRIGADLRLLFPEASILLGGPEVSFDAQILLKKMPWADGILCGEGEGLIARVLAESRPRGVFCADGFIDLDTLPFPYDDLDTLQNRVIYYESTRGCPFGCSYCLSSADRTTRRRSLPLVFADLQRLLDARVMQVKFVDRTFNLYPDRALQIWQYLAAHDNGTTCFQMELGGDLSNNEQISFLKTVRPGLFQFEIGVQSTCGQTMETVCRRTDFAKLSQNVLAVQSAGNIHQHLDLIAGLPGEDFERFAQSYDEVFALHPEQLQLGFLKLLRGSMLYAQRGEYGLVHSDYPPYEVLRTPELSFHDLTRLKSVEEMTEVYYNSGRFENTLGYLWEVCRSPFQAFLTLGEQMPTMRSVGKYEYYDLLFAFAVKQGCDPEILCWLVRFDLLRNERPKKLPACCGEGMTGQFRKELAQLGLPKNWAAEVFPFDVSDRKRIRGKVVIACDYARRDALGHAYCETFAL